MPFWTYMLECADGRFYVGHTDDLERRIAEHQSGSLGGYTARRRPVALVWSDSFSDRTEALAAEARLKGWSRAKKLALIAGDWDEIAWLARSRGAKG
jgi:predicted GIY-YIG superfamily endonuclease